MGIVVRQPVRRMLQLVNRTVGTMLPPTLLARRYPGVLGLVHVDDQMLRSASRDDVDHYARSGRAAVDVLRTALDAAGRDFDGVRACLDLPCGYGRVLRHLAHNIDPRRITASDSSVQAVRFCARAFGAKPVVAAAEPRRTVLPETYDLIFSGSLLTHLPPRTGADLLTVLASVLQPGGVLVFTTQGPSCLHHLQWYGTCFAGAVDLYHAGLANAGADFVAYPRATTYGIAIHGREYVEKLGASVLDGRLQLVHFVERGCDRHQDVWAYQRASSTEVQATPGSAGTRGYPAGRT
jgi:SAM-dependent methyltransferase